MATPLAPGVSGSSSTSSDSAIVVEHLGKAYAGRPVLRDLSFEVRAGEVFSLLGPNGAGKTTTIEILEGYRQPDSGTARVLGLDPRRQSNALHQRIGLMLQNGGFYPTITPNEAIHLFASFYDHPADPEALLQLVGLADARKTRYRRLSGGQKQRLSLAVALIGQPELVFLDEPTAGMDPQARHATWEIVRSLKERGVTIVLTTHLIDEAERLSDRVAIVDGGQVVALGTPTELTRNHAASDLWLTGPAQLDLVALSALSTVRAVHEQSPGTYIFETEAPLRLLAELADWLQAREIMPREIRLGHGSLEDVFLRLTGKELRA